ncbi:hypothetical protein FACS1894145_7880 [Bacteroidia bacterium]|nr:hypothetical protein FACS1894145_7880 [Bacteroidia bacterium]
MNSNFKNMLSQYSPTTKEGKDNTTHEVMHGTTSVANRISYIPNLITSLKIKFMKVEYNRIRINMNKQLQFLIYNTPQENVKIDVVVKDETIWLTQKAMAMLFDVQQPAIAKHLQNIFALDEFTR